MTENPINSGGDADSHVREVVWTMLGARRQKPAELALRLGISKSAIYSRLSGKTVFTVAEVAAMGEHFDLPPSGSQSQLGQYTAAQLAFMHNALLAALADETADPNGPAVDEGKM